MFVPAFTLLGFVWFRAGLAARDSSNPRAPESGPWGRTSLHAKSHDVRPHDCRGHVRKFQISDGPSTIAAASFSLMRTLAFMITNAISQSRKRSAPSPSSTRKRQPACPLAAMKFTACARPRMWSGTPSRCSTKSKGSPPAGRRSAAMGSSTGCRAAQCARRRSSPETKAGRRWARKRWMRRRSAASTACGTALASRSLIFSRALAYAGDQLVGDLERILVAAGERSRGQVAIRRPPWTARPGSSARVSWSRCTIEPTPKDLWVSTNLTIAHLARRPSETCCSLNSGRLSSCTAAKIAGSSARSPVICAA